MKTYQGKERINPSLQPKRSSFGDLDLHFVEKGRKYRFIQKCTKYGIHAIKSLKHEKKDNLFETMDFNIF